MVGPVSFCSRLTNLPKTTSGWSIGAQDRLLRALVFPFQFFTSCAAPCPALISAGICLDTHCSRQCATVKTRLPISRNQVPNSGLEAFGHIARSRILVRPNHLIRCDRLHSYRRQDVNSFNGPSHQHSCQIFDAARDASRARLNRTQGELHVQKDPRRFHSFGRTRFRK